MHNAPVVMYVLTSATKNGRVETGRLGKKY